MAANYPHKTHSQRISFTNIDCSYDQIKSHKQDRQDATPYVKKNRQDDSQKHQTIESRKTEDSIDQKSLSNQKITKTKSDQKINSRPNLSKQNSGSKTSNPNQIKNQKQRVNRPVSSFDKKQEKTRKTPDVTIDLNQSQQNVQSQQIVDVVNVNELIRNQEMLNKTDNNIYLGDSQPQLDNQKKTSDDMNIKSNLRNDIVLDNNDKNYIDLDDSVNAIMKQFNEKRNEQQSSIDQKLNEMRSDYKRPDSSLDQYRDKVKIPNILRVEQLNTSNLEVIKEDEDNQEEPPFIQPDNNKLIYEDKKKQISTQSKNTNINNNNNRNQNQNQKLKPQQQKQQQQQQQQQQQKQQQQKQQQQRNKQNQNQNQNQKQTKKQQQQQTQSQKQVVDQNDPIQQKKQKLEEKIQNILDLQMEDIQEDPPFNFSLLPSSAIDLLEPEFVDDFVKVNMENQVNQDKVLSIVEGFFIINNEEGLIDKDRKVFWENAKKYFSQNKQNIVELVKGITNCGRFEVKKIMRLYKLYNKYPFIIMAQEYDEVDGLCGVLAFVLQDILSYYGILPKENLSQQTYEYKIYMFNKQRFMYYQQKLDAINIKLQ